MITNDNSFMAIMYSLSPGQSFEVPAFAKSSFILNLDRAITFDEEEDLGTPDSLRRIAHTLTSIASSMEDIISAWNAIDEDEEDEEAYANALDVYDTIRDGSIASMEELIKQLQADAEIGDI